MRSGADEIGGDVDHRPHSGVSRIGYIWVRIEIFNAMQWHVVNAYSPEILGSIFRCPAKFI